MSGIFKGDSIYKSGGGGGYKDGGQLVDGDFIKVENNTISSYDNVSRDPVNFYFEVKDGEVLNSVIELTTEVNTTINVYVLKNGLYFLLGNIGGNTVNAGEEYKVNITGDSYEIEEVSGNLTIEYLDVDGVQIKVKKLANKYWTIQNVNNIVVSDYKDRYGQRFYKRNSIQNKVINGFHVPNQTEYNQLVSYYGNDALRSTDMWDGVAGSNSSGFDAKPYGMIRNDNINEGYQSSAFFVTKDSGPFYLRKGGQGFAYSDFYYTLRLCKDA
jgi:uncharacterized protein (TIGR02145 family)